MTPRPLVAALVLCLLVGVSALADTFNVDQDHSQIAWQVDHLGIAQTHGRFDRFSGSFDTGSSPTLMFEIEAKSVNTNSCLLYTSPSPRDLSTSRMPSSA